MEERGWPPWAAILLLTLLQTLTVDAIPGNYFTVDVLKNKWVPDPMIKVNGTSEADCERQCIKHPTCNAFAKHKLMYQCLLYDLELGSSPAKFDGYTLWIKKRTEAEGYYVVGANYYRLMQTRQNAYDAAKTCAEGKGRLVPIRNDYQNDEVVKIMVKHSVWHVIIGLNDEEKEGEWIYSDTGKVTFTKWKWNGVWDRRDRNCAAAIINGFWMHIDCWTPRHYICQYPIY